MRKIVFCSNILLFTLFLACKEKSTITKTKDELKKESKVIFKIDERTEFFRIIFNLAVQDELDEDIRPCKTNYLKRVNNHFKAFKNHPLIDSLYRNENIMLDFSTIGLMYNNIDKFEFEDTYIKDLPSFGITKNELDSLHPLLLDFYKKSNFKSFFTNNSEYYKEAIQKVEKQVKSEHIFDEILKFYQSNETQLEMVVFVELTNNANNKAVSFYDNYNPRKRAIILANICEMPNQSTSANEILELDNDIRAILFHEISHLFTDTLLDKYIGNLEHYESICKDCNDIQIKDHIDHMIVFPLQAVLSYKLYNDDRGQKFFLNKCIDVRKDIFKKLIEYTPKNQDTFEHTYSECIRLIQKSVP